MGLNCGRRAPAVGPSPGQARRAGTPGSSGRRWGSPARLPALQPQDRRGTTRLGTGTQSWSWPSRSGWLPRRPAGRGHPPPSVSRRPPRSRAASGPGRGSGGRFRAGSDPASARQYEPASRPPHARSGAHPPHPPVQEVQSRPATPAQHGVAGGPGMAGQSRQPVRAQLARPADLYPVHWPTPTRVLAGLSVDGSPSNSSGVR